VSIDLNGFTIGGRVFCTGEGGTINCGSGTGRGIDAEGKPRISVRNGHVIDFDVGIIAGEMAQIRDVVSVSHGGNAIEAGSGSTVIGCSVALSEGAGVETGAYSVVRDTISRENKLGGFVLGAGSKLRSSVASGNGGVSLCGGGICTERKRFYLTESLHQGGQAPGACNPGFHMASVWEIRDVSNLAYDWRRADASTAPDSGEGPPNTTSDLGWVRTGRFGYWIEGVVGKDNCVAYNVSDGAGAAARLSATWDDPSGMQSPWEVARPACSNARRVWCVEDE
jgi:hypothetical protein